jgi:GxxExxY protein
MHRENQITDRIIGCAIEVHRTLGPGLLESAYEECLDYELRESGLRVKRQVALPIRYKEIELSAAFRMDLLVEELVIVEVKAVDQLLPIHEAQLLTYLRLTGCRVGLILNFNVPILKDGIRRLVN